MASNTTTTTTGMISSTEILGSRLLREIENQEGSLEDFLKDFQTTYQKHLPLHLQSSRTTIPDLDNLLGGHGSKTLSLTGRPLPLVYHLITRLVSSNESSVEKGGTVVVIDVEGRFSSSHLLSGSDSAVDSGAVAGLKREDLKHIHVFRPTLENLDATLDSVEEYMLYGNHHSKGREWRGLFMLGGSALNLGEGKKRGRGRGKNIGMDILTVTTGWRGWMRVEREEVQGFTVGSSVEEAWGERDRKWEVVVSKGWKGFCEVGEFTF